MVNRKLQFANGSYFTVILRALIDALGLNPGDKVSFGIEDKKIVIAPATLCKDAASAFAVFLLFAKSVSYHFLNMLSSNVTSLSNAFIVLSAVLLSGKVYKTIFTIKLKVIIMGGVIGPAEMERIRKRREKKKKSQ
ncbi:MAG: AbrB/MazE/SpoVT family DNA-binding domain-containing protein [Candidatus Methanoperedens sp.]|nr:AbrB/MazE/SpoVT family DNA-binding domain-containing protein [Candidatus Methanoperedens sp.]MCZ7396395.1 AbrB/MazE/SpoVT family DNA-binding domain-containing protein [Candidatus Methanoperedens sp.]